MHTRYQGYQIKQSPFDSTYVWVEKDGAYIASYSSVRAAQSDVDALVAPVTSPTMGE